MPHSFGVNTETFLVIAWAARQPGLRKRLMRAHEENRSSELALRSSLTGAIPIVFEDVIYGLAYQRLFLHRLEQVDWSYADWALCSRWGVYLAQDDDSDAAGEDAPVGVPASEETALLWEAISQNERLADRFGRLSRDWERKVSRGARLSRLHFLMHLPLLMQTTEPPFLVHELLVMSLERVNWHELAARLLGVPLLPHAAVVDVGSHEEDRVLCVATLLELVLAARRSVGEYVLEPKLSDPMRGLCAHLAEQCNIAYDELRELWEEDQANIAPPAS